MASRMKFFKGSQEVKKKGYLKGTPLWGWRKAIIGGVLLFTAAVDITLYQYATEFDMHKRLEESKQKQQVQMEQYMQRCKDFDKRKEEITNSAKKF